MTEEILNMSFEDYRKVDALNFSTAKHALRCPLSYLAAAKEPSQEATASMTLGTLAHTALLEPATWEFNTVRAPEGIRRGSKAWSEAESKAGRKNIVKPAEYDAAGTIAKSVMSNADARFMLESNIGAPWLSRQEREELEYNLTSTVSSLKEVCYFWNDRRTGLKLKARVDCVSYAWDSLFAVDFKTTDDASPHAMGKRLVTQPYHYLMQLAWYSRAIADHYGQDVDACIIAAEKSNGYPTGRYLIEPDDLERADKMIDDLLDTIVKINNGEMNEQPHYTQRSIYPPDWWYKQQGIEI